jgi:hypothetical protein
MIAMNKGAALELVQQMRKSGGPAHYAFERDLSLEEYQQILPPLLNQLKGAHSEAANRKKRRDFAKSIALIERAIETAVEDFKDRDKQKALAAGFLDQGLNGTEYIAGLKELGQLMRLALRDAPPDIKPGMRRALHRQRELVRFAPVDHAMAAERSRARRTAHEGGN